MHQHPRVTSPLLLRLLVTVAWLAGLVALWLTPPTSPVQLLATLVATYLLTWGAVVGFTRDTAHQWRLRFLATSFSLLLAIILLELTALTGLVDYRLVLGTVGDEPWRNPLNQLDDELLHRHAPNASYTGTQSGGDIAYYLDVPDPQRYPFDVRTDQHGFRNDEDLKDTTVAVIGDSFIEAASVSSEEILTSVLQEELGETVANLGQLWYGPQQELAVLRRYALPLKPRVCVWAFFDGNDLSDFRRYASIHGDWERFSKSLHSSKQKSFVRNAATALFAKLGRPARHSATEIRGTWLDGSDQYFYYRCGPFSQEDEQTLQDLQEVFSQAFQWCEKQGVHLVVAFVPAKYRVYRSSTTFPTDSRYYFWKPNDLPDRIKTIAEMVSSNISFVDLTIDLEAATMEGTETYFRDDTHWTPAGNAIAAQTLARAIRPMLTPESQSGN